MAEFLSKNIAKKGVAEALEFPLIIPSVQNSVHDFLERTAGKQVNKLVTLDGTGTVSKNIFQISGSVYILRLYAIIRDATLMTNCTAVSFDVFPTGGAAVQITKNDGVLSSLPAGTIMAKAALATSTVKIVTAAAAGVLEPTYDGSEVYSACILVEKAGVDTFLRLTYTTTHNPINAQIQVYAEYRGLGVGFLTEV